MNPSRYAIEIRDKDFVLKDRLENSVVSLQWEWNRIGGCGRCTLTIDGDYKRVNVSADDDIRIYLPNSTSGATLWYRGYVETVAPQIASGNSGSIRVECIGYFNWADRIVVHDSEAVKVYTSQEVSLIVDDIIDSFLVPSSPIVAGTIDASSFVPDTLEFKGTAKEVLRTLFDLLGDVEYGVDASLSFFWRRQSSVISDKFFLGGSVIKITDRLDFKNILNKIHFEGGDVGGSTFTPTPATAQDSISRYGLHEEIVSNAAIVTNGVANQYMSSLLLQRARPASQLAVSLKNVTKRFEATQPMGAIAIVDPSTSQTRYKWGKTASGGANKIWGTLVNGGSGIVYGGIRSEQIDRVVYTMSPEDGRVDAELQFGNSIGNSRASAVLKRIEAVQNTLRQRSL